VIVAFVCTGNICRSPMAEAIANTLGLADYTFLSAGTAPMTGHPASPEAVLAAADVGADLSGHRARGLDELRAAEPNVVLTMEPQHSSEVIRRFPEWEGRVQLLDPEARAIADPYGRSAAEYRTARDHIVSALQHHADRWRS
jgi:protein-tyrosine phosphatase